MARHYILELCPANSYNPSREKPATATPESIRIPGYRRCFAATPDSCSRTSLVKPPAPYQGPIEVLEQQLIENLQREDLKPIEEARALDELQRVGNLNSKQLAETIRVNPSKVSRSLALLKLPEDIQREVESGRIAARAAYELSKLSSPEQMRAAITETEGQKELLTVKDAHRRVRQRRGKPAAKSRGVRQTFLSESGWKVVVASPRKGNYHEMEEALVEALAEVRLRIDNNVQLS